MTEKYLYFRTQGTLADDDVVYYDKHAGHGVQYKDILYQVIRSGDVVLID